LRVLHVIGSIDSRGGGPIRAALDISAAGEVFGIRRELLSVGAKQDLKAAAREDFIHCIPLSIPNGYGFAPRLRKWLRLNLDRFDGVVLHGMWQFPMLAAARECRKRGIPYVLFSHGMLEPWSVREQGLWSYIKKRVYWSLLERQTFEQARMLLFTTQREMDESRGSLGFTWPAAEVSPYVIHTGTAPEAKAGATVAGLEGRDFLLFLGRMHPCKNIPFLIRAWARAMKDTKWKLVIAGPSEANYRRKIERFAEDLQVREQCVFIDFVSGAEKEWLFRNARWFALPSEHENFGIAVFEAIVRGCPVVVSDQVYSASHLEPRGRILPLVEDDWAAFFARFLGDDGYRYDVVSSDVQVRDSCSLNTAGPRWAALLRRSFPERSSSKADLLPNAAKSLSS